MRHKTKAVVKNLMVACACSLMFSAHAEDTAKLTTQTELVMGQEDPSSPVSIQCSAAEGNAESQMLLADMYLTGRYMDKDIANAIKWYRKAAEQGNAKGMFALADIYCNGLDVEKNEKEGIEWLQKAAEKQHPQAMYALSLFYQNGSPYLPKDEKKGFELLQKSAEKGNASAQCQLGTFYSRGLPDLPKDEKKAREWYQKAAQQGNEQAKRYLAADAQTSGIAKVTLLDEDDLDATDAKTAYMLAGKFLRGRGCEVDKKKAIRYFTIASKKGLREANNDLAWVYATSQEANVRNGAKAVEYAKKTPLNEPEELDTLAAAYAANGQFDEAVKTEERAIQLFKKKNNQRELNAAGPKLQLYKNKQMYLE